MTFLRGRFVSMLIKKNNRRGDKEREREREEASRERASRASGASERAPREHQESTKRERERERKFAMAGVMASQGDVEAVEHVLSLEASDDENGTDLCVDAALVACDKFPGSQRVMLCLASVMMRANRLHLVAEQQELAQKVFMALELATALGDGTSSSSLSALEKSIAHGLKGVFLSRIVGDIEGGMKEFETSLSLNADNVDALFCSASILDQVLGKPIEAAQLYERVLSIDPQHVTSLNNYSALLIERSRKEPVNGPSRARAKELLLHATALAPGFPHYNLACLAALGVALAVPGSDLQAQEETDCRKWLMDASKLGGIPSVETLESDADFDPVRTKDWFSGLLMTMKDMWLVDFCSGKIRLLPPEGGVCRARETNELVGTTGATVWNSSYAILRFLESKFQTELDTGGNQGSCDSSKMQLPSLFEQMGSSPEWWQGKRVLDLSAGLGLVGLALAQLGASVVLTDIGTDQIDVLRRNASLNGLNESQVHCQLLAWGDMPALQALIQNYGPFDVVFAVDLVYITVRENNAPALLQTLSTLVQSTTQAVVVCFEERKPDAEGQFLVELSKSAAVRAHEFDSALIDQDNGAATADTMFAGLSLQEKPTIRMIELTKHKH